MNSLNSLFSGWAYEEFILSFLIYKKVTFYNATDLGFRGGNPTLPKSFLCKAEALKPIVRPIVKERQRCKVMSGDISVNLAHIRC